MMCGLIANASASQPFDGKHYPTLLEWLGFHPASYATYNDPAPKGAFDKLTLPIKRANNLIIVEAEIDSVVGNFVLDFGAPYLVLNKTYFRDYEKDYSRISGNINSTGHPALTREVGRLELLDLFYEGVDADVVNLGPIEDRRGIKIMGLLGVNLFKDLEVEIDLHNNRLYLTRKSKHSSSLPVEDIVPDLKLDIELYNNVILLEGAIGGKKLRFSLDSGAEVNVLDSRLPGKVFEAFEVNRRMMLTGANGSQTEVLAGMIKEVKFEKLGIKGMKAIITNLEAMSKSYGIRIDGMLGYEFLVTGRIRIDFVNKELKVYLYNK